MGEFRIDHRAHGAAEELAGELVRLTARAGNRPLVVLCIGTDRSIGDALGPLVGTLLQQREFALPLYGTMEDPVHAGSLQDGIMYRIAENHRDPFVVVIDAMLGRTESIGRVVVSPGPIQPGAGVRKNLGLIGDVGITGCVNIGGFLEYFVLQNTRLSLVWSMAHVIAEALELWVEAVLAVRLRWGRYDHA